MGAVEPADTEVHDARLELSAIARERGRASHGAAHRESAKGACVCVAQCIRLGRFYAVRHRRRSAADAFSRSTETRKRVDNFVPPQTESPYAKIETCPTFPKNSRNARFRVYAVPLFRRRKKKNGPRAIPRVEPKKKKFRKFEIRFGTFGVLTRETDPDVSQPRAARVLTVRFDRCAPGKCVIHRKSREKHESGAFAVARAHQRSAPRSGRLSKE